MEAIFPTGHDYDVLFISNPQPKMQIWTHFGWGLFYINY